MSSRYARKRKRDKDRRVAGARGLELKLSRLLGVSELRLRGDISEIHSRANLISEKMYEVVDAAPSAVERRILADECCQAMASHAGVSELRWHDGGQWAQAVDNWTVGA